jgi:peptidylprolyl isomerase
MTKKHFIISLPVLFTCGMLCLQPSLSFGSQKSTKVDPKAEEKAAIKTEEKIVAQVEEKATVKEEEKTLDVPKVSEAFGHLIGKNLDSLGFKFDMDKIIQGIQDSVIGKDSPMSESECIQAISQDQEKKFKKLAEVNLQEAAKFLETNLSQEGIVVLEDKKLQYKVETEGTGETVQAHFSPLIKYTGKFLDGKIFGASKEDEMISLDETIPGFSKGIIGMKEGEKRTLYIHPDLAYGVNGNLPPNSLLTFEIELVKANNPQEQDTLMSSTAADADEEGELAVEELSEQTR